MALDFLRVTIFTLADIPAYFAASTTLGLAQAVLLLAAAQGIYFSSGTTFGNFFGQLSRRKGHALLFWAFVAVAAFAILYSLFVESPGAATVTDFAGRPVPAAAVSAGLVGIVIVLFAFFLAYPTALLRFGASKVEDLKLRRSILGLGLGWVLVTWLYILASAYMWFYGVDALGLMYLANAAIFFVIIRNFRQSASIAGFVEKETPTRREGAPVTERRVSPLAESLVGKKILYEVDPTVPYEVNLRKTLEELAWAGHAAFIFTPTASPLHSALKGATGAKFFLTTSGVSYMKVSDETSEVLIPQGDTAIFLDVADKTLHTRQGKIVFVFDSVSELLLMNGLERTYKFLKQFLELLHEPRSTGIFIFVGKAHQAREVNLLRGIFPNQFVEDTQGARLIK